MNELIFLVHVLLIMIFTLMSLRLGKSALKTWICLQALLANLFVLKQTALFGFNITCSDVFAIGGILGLNLLQEHYNKKAAQITAKNCFYFMLFFAALSKIHLLYHPSPEDMTHASYHTILSPAPRLLFASLTVFFVVQKIDIRLFSWMKKHFHLLSFSSRTLISLLCSQLLDTIFFSILGLYGLVFSITDVILVSFLAKAVIIFSLAPMTLLSKKWIQPKDIPL